MTSRCCRRSAGAGKVDLRAGGLPAPLRPAVGLGTPADASASRRTCASRVRASSRARAGFAVRRCRRRVRAWRSSSAARSSPCRPRRATRATSRPRPAAHERSPVWSPDGTRLAYFSDESGDYQLYIRAQDGKGDADRSSAQRQRLLRRAGLVARQPASSRIRDNSQSLYWLDVQVRQISEGRSRADLRRRRVPDRHVLVARFEVACLHDWQSSRRSCRCPPFRSSRQVVPDHRWPQRCDASRSSTPTANTSTSSASTDAGPVLDWFSHVERRHAADAQRLPRGAEEGRAVAAGEGERRREGRRSEEAGGQDQQPPKEARRKASRSPARRKRRTAADRPRRPSRRRSPRRRPARPDSGSISTTFSIAFSTCRSLPATSSTCRLAPPGSCSSCGRPTASPRCSASTSRSARSTRCVRRDGLRGHRRRQEAALRTAEQLVHRLDPGAHRAECRRTTGDVDAMDVRVDPQAEWPQIFNEAWRINRDYFYAPTMHGANWTAMHEEVRAVPRRTWRPRDDLNRVIQWMSSELAVGHHHGGGGDSPAEPRTVPGGLLGADYEVENGRYRFKKVYGGLNWTPKLRAPLTEPGVNVQAGEYLLAVDGVDLRPPTNLYAPFENTAGKLVEITVGPNPDGTGLAHRAGRADRERGGAAQSRLGRRQPAEGRPRPPTAASPTSTCRTPPAGHDVLQALLLPADPQRRGHRRRALQRRRPGGRLLHRYPASSVRQLLGDAAWRPI